MEKINSLKLGLSLGIISAICMLLLGILGNFGFYLGAVEMMTQWHMFFDSSFFGILFGMIEAGIVGYLIGYLIGYFYNRFKWK